MVEMKVKGLVVDAHNHMPIVILTDLEERRYLPIWIGVFEANAILMELKGITTPRPMTHDLIKSLLESLNVTVTKILIHSIQDNTFYALITLENGGLKVDVDSRPSDAIALALRMNVPIFVSENVILKATFMDKEKYEEEAEQFRRFLENLKPEDFGKYTH